MNQFNSFVENDLEIFVELVSGAPGSTGDKGDRGDRGNGIISTSILYQKSTSGTNIPAGTWMSSVPATSSGEYLWTKLTLTYTDGEIETAYSVGRHGVVGPQGLKGDKPAHSWTGTSLRFENPDGTQGAAVDLKGEKGDTGEKGNTGSTGATGNGVSTTQVTYQASSSGTTVPTGTWTATIPTTAAGQYLWSRAVINYTNGTNTTIYSVARHGLTGSQGIQGVKGDKPSHTWVGTTLRFENPDGTQGAAVDLKGEKGNTGEAGNGILNSIINYQKSSSGTTVPTGTWMTTLPATSPGEYLWTRMTVNYTNLTSSVMYSVGKHGETGLKGDKGDKGDAGAKGEKGETGVSVNGYSITYQVSSSGSVIPSGAWLVNIPSTSPGQFLWTRNIFTLSDSTTATSYTIGAHGLTGPKGDKGEKGETGEKGSPGDPMDVTNAWIKSMYESNADTNVFDDAAKNKLDSLFNLPKATQSEINNGSNVNKYIAPLEMKTVTDEIRKDAPYFIVGTGTTAGKWLGTHPKITAYFEGMMINYAINIAGVSAGTTLNINGLGEIPVRYNNSNFTTQIPVNSVVNLVYTVQGGVAAFRWSNYSQTYSLITSAEINAGTSNTGRTISALRLKEGVESIGGSKNVGSFTSNNSLITYVIANNLPSGGYFALINEHSIFFNLSNNSTEIRATIYSSAEFMITRIIYSKTTSSITAQIDQSLFDLVDISELAYYLRKNDDGNYVGDEYSSIELHGGSIILRDNIDARGMIGFSSEDKSVVTILASTPDGQFTTTQVIDGELDPTALDILATQRYVNSPETNEYSSNISINKSGQDNYIGKVIVINSSTNTNITLYSDVRKDSELAVIRKGTGTVTFVAASGVTILSADNKVQIKKVNGTVALKKISATEWVISGGLG